MALLRPRVVDNEQLVNGKVRIAGGQEGPLTEVLKWIPLEVIAFYQALTAAIPSGNTPARLWLTGAGIVVCGLWIAFTTKPKNKGYAWRQIILAMFAFVFWAAAVQAEILNAFIPWWQPWMGAIVLIFGSMLLPIINGILTRLGVPQNK